jgi:hypothetical protein
MALPNGAGGYQVGAGNNNETILSASAAPQTATDTATLTAAQIVGGMLVATPTANATLTLPTAALIDAAIPNARVGSTFDLALINAAAATYTAAFALSTGVTNGGNAVVSLAAATSALFRFRKTGDAAYVVYKIA